MAERTKNKAQKDNEDLSSRDHAVHHPSTRGTGAVTLDDVAKLAGVSPITVSRALNHPEKVAAETLTRINDAISRTGYVPNLLAGGLASSRSRLIAAIVPTIANSVYAETIKHLSEELRDSGYQVLLGESGFTQEQEEGLISAILSRRPDGIFLTGVNHSHNSRRLLLAANVPMVETWDLSPSPLDVVIGFSHEQIGSAVARFLYDKGYRKVGIVSAIDHRAQVRQRVFTETLQNLGVEDIAVSNVPVPTTFQLGRDGLARLLEKGFGEGGAVFCSSDTLAQGALAEAQARGLSIPGQVAIMGFGDQPYAAYTHPPLTTVRFDRAAIGRQAARVLLARLSGEEVPEKVIDVGFQIVERETA